MPSLPAAALEVEESADPLRRIVPILQFPVFDLAALGEAPLEPAQLVARLPRMRFFQQAVAVPARLEQRTPELVRHVRTMRIREHLGERRQKRAIAVDLSPLDDQATLVCCQPVEIPVQAALRLAAADERRA